MIKIASARLKDHADNEERILWGIAFDAGEMTVNGRKWQTSLALDELGWLHIWRTNSDKETRHARVPPDMIRIVYDAAPNLLDEPEATEAELVAAKVLDPDWRHPKAIKR